MHRYSANYIYPINGVPIRNGIVVIDNSRKIVEIVDPKGNEKEYESMEFYNGVIVPGFVNAHCHLELSHLKGRLEKSDGIAGFVSQIRNLRGDSEGLIRSSITQAISTLELNGTVAVGDICNTADSFSFKQASNLHFHNFIELFGLLEDDAEARFVNAKLLLNETLPLQSTSSLAPHSPYSISDRLWGFISDELHKSDSIVSIHYGESLQEYSFLMNRTGLLAESFKALGISDGIALGITPFEVVKKYLPHASPTLFIHNTFVKRDEVRGIIKHFDKPYFVLCPTSNLFIEGCLPDIPMLMNEGACIAVGTDSLASSNTLSVFDQILIILEKFSALTFDDAIKWATLNGAEALGVESIYGSLEKGKSPGLNLITNFDFSLMKPTKMSRVRRLA
ncbi:MAG: hypothetical protein EHM93_07965 [Bacteroidales bacterium]|nr:MAG: hypothetical protein EHM93_07965 [Bacteroidales bacterium]